MKNEAKNNRTFIPVPIRTDLVIWWDTNRQSRPQWGHAVTSHAMLHPQPAHVLPATLAIGGVAGSGSPPIHRPSRTDTVVNGMAPALYYSCSGFCIWTGTLLLRLDALSSWITSTNEPIKRAIETPAMMPVIKRRGLFDSYDVMS